MKLTIMRWILLVAVIFSLGCGKDTPNIEGDGKAKVTRSVTLDVPSMHCSSCVGTIRGALRNVEGVESSTFDLENRQVTIVVGGTKTQDADLEKAITAAGFEIKKTP